MNYIAVVEDSAQDRAVLDSYLEIKADKQNHDLLKIRKRICIILIR